MQQKFSKLNGLYVVLPTLVVAFGWFAQALAIAPPRHEQTLALRFDPVRLDGDDPPGLRRIGAWQIVARHRAFGGWSGLAVDGEGLIAVSDNGAFLRFAPPRPGEGHARRNARFGPLPVAGAKGPPKLARDSESIARDGRGRGWWVGFEQSHRLVLFDPALRRALRTVSLAGQRYPANRGIEGLAQERGSLRLFPEQKARDSLALGASGAVAVAKPLVDALPGATAGAESWPVGPAGTLMLRRAVSRGGFSAWLADPDRAGSALTLPLGPFDNAEGLAIQPQRDSSARIWILTDDNFQWPQRTVLLGYDAPPGWRPRRR